VRRLAECADGRRAGDLVDTLLAHGIDSQVRGEGEREVWVLDDDALARANTIFKEFEENGPQAVAGKAAEIRRRRVQEQAGRDHNFVHVRSTWREAEQLGLGPVTIFLLVGSVLVGVYSGMGDPQTMTVQNLSIEPWRSGELLGRVRDGEVWRLVTPMFIHFGLVHLLFNMMGVQRFARAVEHHHGSLILMLLVLWTQIPGAIGQYVTTGPWFGGMSGVLYGLFGFVWMQARFNRRRRYVIDEFTTWMMLVWFIVCLTGGAGPIANVAHAGGLIAGILAGLPAYLGYLRGRAANPEFNQHSWADVHVRGKSRVYRQFVAPYVPLWLLLIAGVAIALEHLG
jgi:GlpG protein